MDTSHSFDYLWSIPMLKQEMGLFWCDHYLNNMKANTEIFLTKLIVFCNTCLGKRSSFLVFMGLKSYNFLCLAINHAGVVRNTILLAHSYGKRKCWNQNFFYRKLTGIVWMKQGLSNFDSSPLTCEPFCVSWQK